MRVVRPVTCLVLWIGVSVAACAPVEPDLRAEVVAPGDPDQPGPYAVGITTIVLRGVEGQRDIPVEVWYPATADATDGNEPTTYDVFGVLLPADGYRDVPPDPTAPSYLIAFSHGLGGVRIQNYTMAERLASFGFIVVAPDHPGTTAQDFVLNYGLLTDPLYNRPGTIMAAVDAVYDGAVEGVVPRDGGYGFIGHSMGALTGMYVGGGQFDFDAYRSTCASGEQATACGLVGDLTPTEAQLANLPPHDDRIQTTVLQSPAGHFAFHPESFAAIREPFVMAGALDGMGYNECALPMFPLLAPGAAMMVYAGAGHNAPTNMCNIPLASTFSPDCGGEEDGFADPAALLALTVRHTVAWMGARLGDQPSFEAYLVSGEGHDWQTN